MTKEMFGTSPVQVMTDITMVPMVEHPVYLLTIVTNMDTVTTLHMGITAHTVNLQVGIGLLTITLLPTMFTQCTDGVTTSHHGSGVATLLLKDS